MQADGRDLQERPRKQPRLLGPVPITTIRTVATEAEVDELLASMRSELSSAVRRGAKLAVAVEIKEAEST